MADTKYAFKCRNCGHLETAGAAGEMERPAACRECGHGVRFDTVTGLRSNDPDNWIVLAELPADERAAVVRFHGIDEKAIERHKPFPAATAERAAAHHVRTAEDGLGMEDHPS